MELIQNNVVTGLGLSINGTERNLGAKSTGIFQIDRMDLLEAENCRRRGWRGLASWKQDEPYQAFTRGVAQCWTMTMETAEDVLRGLESIKVNEGDKEMVGRMKTARRKLHKQAQEQFCNGQQVRFQAVNRIFEQAAEYEGLTTRSGRRCRRT
jgi:hypothetical protein